MTSATAQRSLADESKGGDAGAPIANEMARKTAPDAEEDDESVPHVRPKRFGSADPPTNAVSDFVGRGGVWHCENCSKATVLENPTKEWKCKQCKTTMYTLPPDECPLDTYCPCCCWDTILGRT